MAELKHIEIMKEDMVGAYRFPPFPNAPKPTKKTDGRMVENLQRN